MSGAAAPAAPAAPRAAPTAPAGLREAPHPTGLYVHFPFCAHRCHYCDFSVRRARVPPIAEWVEAIERELCAWFRTASWEPPIPLETLYVGGGTPSMMGADGMSRLAERLRRWFAWNEREIEWTVEANPASFDSGTGRAWRALGVNRLSLGIQSLDDAALRWLGRLHDREGALRALAAARRAGFERVNADLMFGLPDEVTRHWPAELARLVAETPAHVSAYGLTIEPRTPLGRRLRLGHVRPPDDARYEAEYEAVSRALLDAGYGHYEVSSFARPGAECRHNWKYWNGEPYLGVGPSAHSFLPPFRTWNAFRWDAYRGTIRVLAPPLEGWERPAPGDRELERVWLGLRTRRGLDAEDPVWRGGRNASRLARWIEAGWLERRGDRIVATVRGWLRLDALVAELAAGRAEPVS